MAAFEGFKWAMVNGVTQVTWSFATSNYTQLAQQYTGYKTFDSQIADSEKAAVRAAFNAWEKVAKIDFVEVADSPSVNIRIGNIFLDGYPAQGQSTKLGETQYWNNGAFFSAVQIYYDTDAHQSSAYFYEVSVHEIGHALGLNHSSDPNNIMYFQTNVQNLDGLLTSDDIAGAVQLYGATATTPTTPTVPTPTALPPNAATTFFVSAAETATFTGQSPTQSVYLAQADFAQKQYDYYANVLKVSAPSLGPYEALGKAFGDTPGFSTKYGPSVDPTSIQFINHAYQDVFHVTPTAAVQSFFLSQLTYFTNLYETGIVGITPAVAQIEARGAVAGLMIGYIMTDPSALLDKQVASFVAQVYAGNTSLFGKAWLTGSAFATAAGTDMLSSWASADRQQSYAAVQPMISESDFSVKIVGGVGDPAANNTKDYHLLVG